MAVATRIQTDVDCALELDGIACGRLNAVAGGDVVADVTSGPAKNIKTPFVEPVTLEVGFNMSKPVYEWIASSWAGSAAPRDFSIILAGANLERTSDRVYAKAIITETTVCALVAAGPRPVAKAATLTVRLQAERASEQPAQGVLSPESGRRNKALSSNFKLEIDGLECTFVTAIDSFTVKADPVSGSIDFPNLRVTIPTARAAGWKEWHQDAVVNGKQVRKSGRVTLYALDLATEICHVELTDLGICALRRSPLPVRGDEISRLTADLYCDEMKFVYV